MVDIEQLWKSEITWGSSDHPVHGSSLMNAVAWIETGTLTDHSSICPVLGIMARIVNDALPHDERQKLRKYIPLLARTADPQSTTLRFIALVRLVTRVQHPILAHIPFLGEKLFRAQLADMSGNLEYADNKTLITLFHLSEARLLREFDRLLAIGQPSRPWTARWVRRAARRFEIAAKSTPTQDLEEFVSAL